MTQLDTANMAEAATSAILDSASDYGDFGSDAEELEILHDLLAQVTSGNEEGQEPCVVTDIEDYEPPRGILLPKTAIETRLPTSQLEAGADIEVLRDIQAASGT